MSSNKEHFGAGQCTHCGGILDGTAETCPACGRPQKGGALSVLLSGQRYGLWRSGTLLVAHRSARFPARCLKTNQPTSTFVRQRFLWMHPAFLLLLMCFCVPPIGLAVLAVLFFATRSAKMELPFSPAVLEMQRRAILICMTALAAVCVFFPIGAVMQDELFAVAGACCLLALVVYIAFSNIATLVSVDRIAGDYIYIRGVCPAFLQELPHVP